MSELKKGVIVKCPETGRIGIILETRRGAWTTYARVHWNSGETTLTECCELELIPNQ